MAVYSFTSHAILHHVRIVVAHVLLTNVALLSAEGLHFSANEFYRLVECTKTI